MRGEKCGATNQENRGGGGDNGGEEACGMKYGEKNMNSLHADK